MRFYGNLISINTIIEIRLLELNHREISIGLNFLIASRSENMIQTYYPYPYTFVLRDKSCMFVVRQLMRELLF